MIITIIIIIISSSRSSNIISIIITISIDTRSAIGTAAAGKRGVGQPLLFRLPLLLKLRLPRPDGGLDIVTFTITITIVII